MRIWKSSKGEKNSNFQFVRVARLEAATHIVDCTNIFLVSLLVCLCERGWMTEPKILTYG